MEPRQSMTRYAALVALALVVRSATGGWALALYAAGALLLAGVILDGGLRVAVRRARSHVPPHRVPLDRLVRWQWPGASLVGLTTALAAHLLDAERLHLDRFLDAAITAAALAIIAVQVSSLVDWYWILPRVSGVVRRAPCERAGGQLWARVTGVWLFHRAVATLLVTGALTGVLLYMGQAAESDAKTVWFIAAAIVGAAVLAFNSASFRALWLAFNPRLHVGDILDIHGRDCYVVDVSLQGAKYMVISGTERAAFADKYDGSFPLEEFGRYERSPEAQPPCARGCTKINWYCRHNPRAHD